MALPSLYVHGRHRSEISVAVEKTAERSPYLAAVAALDSADRARLARLLTQHPSLVGERWHAGDWYASGYFAGAMLLHHVAGNPIRHPLPANVVEVTRVLLEHGADPNAETDDGWTTIGLILTSRQASEAAVALPLIDLLQVAGASFDLDSPDLLTAPILNHAPVTAHALMQRGAVMDVRHAAGLGSLDVLKILLANGPDPGLLEEALAFACVRGQAGAVLVLLDAGARGDVLVTHGGRSPCTALHEAANRGHREIVGQLLAHGADATVVEPHWGGTPAGWAEHGDHPELAALLREHGS